MSLLIYILITITIVILAVLIYFLHKKKLTKDEKRLVKFLKKNNGEADPRYLKLKMKVSREWLEDVAKRLEEKGKIVRWGWRVKSLICLKKSVVKNEKKVVKLLKANGGRMGQFEAGEKLGYDRESFGWRMVRKLEAKGVVEVRTHGKKNFLVLVNGKNLATDYTDLHGYDGEGKVELSKREERLVKILKKSGGEMLDRNLAVRMRDSDKIIRSLIKKGIVFRWGHKKRNVCLKEMLNEEEEKLIKILKDSDGKMMWRELVKKSGYCGKGFHRVLDKLEVKGRIIRRKVGRSLEVVRI